MTVDDGARMTVDPKPRRRPANRRLAETRRVIYERPDGNTTKIIVTVGYEAETPTRPIEVFYSEGFRSGSDLEFTVQDACVLISLLLQHGVSIDRIAASMSTRETADADLTSGEFVAPAVGTATPASMAGAIVAELAIPPVWADTVNE